MSDGAKPGLWSKVFGPDFGKGAQPPEAPPREPEGIDPAAVLAVASRAARWLQGGDGAVAEQARLLEDLTALALEAEEAVERHGPLRPGPWRGYGPPHPVPRWWREEYCDDPLLHALAQMGVPAGVALAQVIAAYWSLRGVMVSAAIRATPAIRIEAPSLEVVEAAKNAVRVAHPIAGIGGPGYVIHEAEMKALESAVNGKGSLG